MFCLYYTWRRSINFIRWKSISVIEVSSFDIRLSEPKLHEFCKWQMHRLSSLWIKLNRLKKLYLFYVSLFGKTTIMRSKMEAAREWAHITSSVNEHLLIGLLNRSPNMTGQNNRLRRTPTGLQVKRRLTWMNYTKAQKKHSWSTAKKIHADDVMTDKLASREVARGVGWPSRMEDRGLCRGIVNK